MSSARGYIYVLSNPTGGCIRFGCLTAVLCAGLLVACDETKPAKPTPVAQAQSTTSTHIAIAVLSNLQQELRQSEPLESNMRLVGAISNPEALQKEHHPNAARVTRWASSGWHELQGVAWELSDVPSTALAVGRPRRVLTHTGELHVGCLETAAFEDIFSKFKVSAASCLSIHEWSEHRVNSTACFENRTANDQYWTLVLTKDRTGNCVTKFTAHFEGKKQ